MPAALVPNRCPARRRRRILVAALAAVAGGAAAPSALACIDVGVYQDNPARLYPALTKAVGPGVSTVQTYVSTGQRVDAKLLALVRARKLRLVVTWMPNNGSDGAKKPRYRLSAVAKGRFDTDLRALVKQLRPLNHGVILRPMPEPNTPWHAWSGLANGNTPARYVAAWKHVRKVVRGAAGTRVKLLWSPYARSIPDTPANAIAAYFPGAAQVDLVGVDAYNFGAKHGLAWSTPGDLFAGAYEAIGPLAPGKPFWVTETGSTSAGGNKAGWISDLAQLPASIPTLQGVIWFDVKDPTGDFRIRSSPGTVKAFRTLLSGRCK